MGTISYMIPGSATHDTLLAQNFVLLLSSSLIPRVHPTSHCSVFSGLFCVSFFLGGRGQRRRFCISGTGLDPYGKFDNS